MMPIRKGDGTGLDAQGYSQIRKGDGAVLWNAISDSVLVQHTAAGYSMGVSSIADDADADGTQPLSLTGDPQAATLSDGSDSLAFDATDDYGAVTLPAEFEGSGLNSFAIEIAGQYSSNTGKWGVGNNNNNQYIHFAPNEDTGFNSSAGTFTFRIKDIDSNELFVEPSSNPSIDDGDRHDISLIVNDAANNDVDIILDGSTLSLNFASSQSPSNFGTWEDDFFYNAFNNQAIDSIVKYQGGNVGAVRWHGQAITEQTIQGYPF